MAVHRKPEEKLLCPVCGSGFGRDSSLKRHQNTPGSCQKKRQAKLHDISGPKAGSHHNFGGSTTSSYHGGSDTVSVDNSLPHDLRCHQRLQPGSNLITSSHVLASPRPLHGVQYGHRQPGPGCFPQLSLGPGQTHPARNPHCGTGLQTQLQATGWVGIDPTLWPPDGVGVGPEFGDFVDFSD